MDRDDLLRRLIEILFALVVQFLYRDLLPWSIRTLKSTKEGDHHDRST